LRTGLRHPRRSNDKFAAWVIWLDGLKRRAGAYAASTGSQREAFKSLRPLTGEDDFCR